MRIAATHAPRPAARILSRASRLAANSDDSSSICCRLGPSYKADPMELRWLAAIVVVPCRP
jgi:hypothetical protein